MAPHSSTLAWRIPWTEEPGRLQTMASQRVGHDWATSLHVTSCNSAFSTVLSTHLCAYTCHFIQFFDTCKHLTLRYSAQNVGSKYQAVPKISTFGCCSVAQLCPTCRAGMQRRHSTPGLTVHCLPELAQFMPIDWLMLSNRSTLCQPLLFLPSIFPSSSVFLMNQLSASGDQIIGASASASVLPMNVQY